MGSEGKITAVIADERHLVSRFRAMAFGVFAFTCLFGFLLQHLGVQSMQGF
jgi:hypothetical protein